MHIDYARVEMFQEGTPWNTQSHWLNHVSINLREREKCCPFFLRSIKQMAKKRRKTWESHRSSLTNSEKNVIHVRSILRHSQWKNGQISCSRTKLTRHYLSCQQVVWIKSGLRQLTCRCGWRCKKLTGWINRPNEGPSTPQWVARLHCLPPSLSISGDRLIQRFERTNIFLQTESNPPAQPVGKSRTAPLKDDTQTRLQKQYSQKLRNYARMPPSSSGVYKSIINYPMRAWLLWFGSCPIGQTAGEWAHILLFRFLIFLFKNEGEKITEEEKWSRHLALTDDRCTQHSNFP